MEGRLRAVLLTGDSSRHAWVASELAGQVELVGLVVEPKAPASETDSGLVENDQLMHDHLRERDLTEQRLLGSPSYPEGVPTLEIARGTLSSSGVAEWVLEREPDVVFLFGTGILRGQLVATLKGRVINMHLGLSPYYRGSGTNFWPLVDGLPELVGTTIHLAVDDVDAGPILAQVRPPVEAEDGPHELGTKAMMAGAQLLGSSAERYLRGELAPSPPLEAEGKVSRRRDFNADAVRTLRRRFAEGMLQEYVAHAVTRQAAYPIFGG